VRFDSTPVIAIESPGWYLRRPGFFWGGIGVAACWWGAAVGIARGVYAAAGSKEPDQIALMHLGAIDAALTHARAVLLESALRIDAGADTDELPVLMMRARAIVADAVETTISAAAHALGPAPLALDEEHARRVADLQIYVRQHHAERDLAALGRELLRVGADAPW
jgi:hypothetical protein